MWSLLFEEVQPVLSTRLTRALNRACLAAKGLAATAQRHTTVPKLTLMLHHLNLCNTGSHTSEFASPYRARHECQFILSNSLRFYIYPAKAFRPQKEKVMSLFIFDGLDDWGSRTKDPQHWLHKCFMLRKHIGKLQLPGCSTFSRPSINLPFRLIKLLVISSRNEENK